ncbi:MAG: hypothetical protein NVSMB52_13020 [Chloroflexota bacterium]
MRQCPRCKSSMLLHFHDAADTTARTWKCVGCAREIFEDTDRQAEDDRLLETIARSVVRKARGGTL